MLIFSSFNLFSIGREIPQACQKEDCQRVCNLGLTIDPEQEMLKLFEVDLKISVFVQSYLSNTSNFIQKFPTITMITNSSNLIETIHRIPTVQLMNRWARSNSLKQNLNAIDPFIYPLLIWILAHPQNIIRKIQYDKIPVSYSSFFYFLLFSLFYFLLFSLIVITQG